MWDKINPNQNYEYYPLPNSTTVEKNNPTQKVGSDDNDAEVKSKKRTGQIECQACSSRRYIDGSDDPGVSFKTPTKISPTNSVSAVMGHEMEHYTREQSKAERENREVLSNSIKIFRDVCPECGVSFVSGGLTTTITRGRSDKDKEHFENQFFEQTVKPYFATKIDEEI